MNLAQLLQVAASGAAQSSGAVTIKRMASSSRAAGSPPTPNVLTLDVEAGDQITIAYTASGTFLSRFTPTCSDDASNAYTLLSDAPTSGGSPRQLFWTATAAASGTITISVDGSWYYGYASAAVYITTSGAYEAPSSVPISGESVWQMQLPYAPPAQSLVIVAAEFGGIPYTTSGFSEDEASDTPNVSIGHVVSPTTASIGSYNFTSGDQGGYSALVIHP